MTQPNIAHDFPRRYTAALRASDDIIDLARFEKLNEQTYKLEAAIGFMAMIMGLLALTIVVIFATIFVPAVVPIDAYAIGATITIGVAMLYMALLRWWYRRIHRLRLERDRLRLQLALYALQHRQ